MKITCWVVIALLCVVFLQTSSSAEVLGTAVEGGRGLLYMQSARTYGFGYYTLGIHALAMQREHRITDTYSVKDTPVIVVIPATVGLTDHVDITGSLYLFNDIRPFDQTNQFAPYANPEAGVGTARLGFKIRLPFSVENKLQIAGKMGALLDISQYQTDGLNYRWTRKGTDVEASLLESYDVTPSFSINLEQGYVLSGSDIFDDQYVLAVGFDFHPGDRWRFGLEANNRVFDSVGPNSVFQAGKDPSNYYGGAIVGDPTMLRETDLDFMKDFFVVVPSVSYQISNGITLHAGAIVNIADQEDPKETVQGVVGISYHGSVKAFVDTDGDGVKNARDREPNTPKNYPVDASGVSLDSDGDGVPDGRDREPRTPNGVKVDLWGVGKDNDGDGVYDGLDKEPNTPKGCVVDANGVALDEDKDGVPNCLDKEPNTPEGCPVDTQGVALDSDGDGIPNCKDLEADTPKGSTVDIYGRAVQAEERALIKEGMLRLDKVYFGSGKATLLPRSYDALKVIAEILVKYPTLRIQIEGHTDSQGPRDKNLELSRARAQAVLDFLLSLEPMLKRAQFTVVGFGPDKPISTNMTAYGRQLNRRVEFVVLNKEELRKYTPKK